MEFNNEFAAKTWDLISKMDDDEAQMFVRFVAYDTLMEDIARNRRSIDRAVSEIHKSIQRDVGDKLPEEHAKLVSLVSKDWSTNYEEKYHRPQNRDSSGRWSVTISREKNKIKPVKGDVHVGDFNLTGALKGTGDNISEFERRWNARGQDEVSTTAGMYSRIGAGSHVLTQAGKKSGNAKLRLAGEAGEFFGKYGPQAEAVIGPHMRRTAYRFRGTERTPDPELTKHVVKEVSDIGRAEGLTHNSQFTEPMMRTASEKAAIRYLSQRLPSKKLAALQAASGKIPPSEGVIINADGKIITQSVGYMDDHYLPFNLKNLKGLQGGTYVRTRSSGGPTTEDIYTGLVSGARSLTVVSRSGIFTVDFEDDFRGGRRFNDKAAGMVSRYAKTLDAVQSEQVQARDLSGSEKLEIREEVENEMRGFTGSEIEAEISRRIKEQRAKPTITAQEMNNINRKAVEAAQEGGKMPHGQFSQREWAQIQNDPKKRVLAYRQSMIEDLMAEKQNRKFQLDGDGYAASMDALHEQFPYYISQVNYITHTDPRAHGMGLSSEKDTGYVKPRFNRPAGAQEGYFDESITGRGKTSADRTNYQNYAVRRKPDADKVDTKDESAEENTTESPLKRAQKNRQAFANAQAEKRVNEELRSIHEAYKDIDIEGKSFPVLESVKSGSRSLDEVLGTEKLREDLEKELNQVHGTLTGVVNGTGSNARPEYKPNWDTAAKALRNIEGFRATKGDRPFDLAKYAGEASPKQAYTFEGAAYVPGSQPEDYRREYESVNQRLGAIFGLNAGLPSFDDEKMRKAANQFGAMYKIAAEVKAGNLKDQDEVFKKISDVSDPSVTEEQVNRLSAQIMHNPDARGKAYLHGVEDIERLRRIKMSAGDALAEPKKAEAASGQTIQGSLVPVERTEAPQSAREVSGRTAIANKRIFDDELTSKWAEVDEESDLNDDLAALQYAIHHNKVADIKDALDAVQRKDKSLHKWVVNRMVDLGLWHAGTD